MRGWRIGMVVMAASLLVGCAATQEAASPSAISSDTPPSSAPTSEPRSSASAPDSGAAEAEQIAAAETFIDAFYSFDPAALEETLAAANESAPRILAYQAWAEGAHYKVLERAGCATIGPDVVECPVTVEDDLLLALESDFKVTDVFTLTFDGEDIIAVDTGSDDPAIVGQGFEWVFSNDPELLEGACEGFAQGVLVNGGDCARAVVDGLREFAASEDFPGP
jgi:hypothetical protein